MSNASIVIVSPALADANNGNWQTARRWQRMLSPIHRTRIVRAWPDADASPADAVLLALHARRSAASVQAWAQAHPAPAGASATAGSPGLAVVLTGTDLYRDIHNDTQAQRSLALAQRLVVLQECGPDELPPALRPKARVIFQSAPTRQTLPKSGHHLRALMVGHLREVKSPQTLMQAAQLLQGEPTILIDHIGDALDPALGDQARATAAQCPGYRWLGGQPHEATRRRIQRAHVLVHCSQMEGGAHVILEAVRSGTPVLASRVAGNVGMLGAGYAGYFEHGDAAALARLLRQCVPPGPAPSGGTASPYLTQLASQCGQRAALFDPAAECATLTHLVQDLLETR